MPKWISVEEAAAKYGINKEVIWLWADMKRFPMSYEKVSPLLMKKALSDSCIRIRIELQPSISTQLEDLCIEKANICNLYAEIIGCQDKELLYQREQIARMKEIQTAMKRQNSRLRDCEKVFTKYEENFSTCWVGRICAHLRRLIWLIRR